MGKLKPSFGDVVENGWASDDNPTRRGFFVRAFKRAGRMNPGLTWEITDKLGKFWEIQPAFIGERLTVIPAARSEAQPSGYDASQPVAWIVEWRNKPSPGAKVPGGGSCIIRNNYAHVEGKVATLRGLSWIETVTVTPLAPVAALTFTASLSDASPKPAEGGA